MKDWPDGGVSVDVSSYGLLVPEDQVEAIFERGIRGSNVQATGSGLGLYVAQLVAKANGFWILYVPERRGEDKGINHFKFQVPPRAPIKGP